jgi:hypothetical protein
MRRITFTIAAVAALAFPAGAQRNAIANTGKEIRSFVGAFVPTGSQENDFKAATTVGITLAEELTDHLHVLGSVAWTHGHNKFAGFNDDRTFIWQYDGGLELNSLHWLTDEWLLRPLVGVGVGARTYDYQATNISSYTCSAGYGSVGSELQHGIVALRFEARDYINCFKSPVKSTNSTRNDLSLNFGIVYHIR